MDTLISKFKSTVIGVFRRRGLATAELLFRNNPFEPPDMPELFESVFSVASTLKSFDLRSQYCDYVMDLLTKPDDIQRRYLSNIAQGFFAYHMFGKDPSGMEIRRRLVQETIWLCDANIFMPLLAKQCHSHAFITDLLNRVHDLGIRVITTRAFVMEVKKALDWAIRLMHRLPYTTQHAAILEAVKQPDYRENLFIDGYIRGYAEKLWTSFDDYLLELNMRSFDDAIAVVSSLGIEVRELSDLCGVGKEEIEQVSTISDEIFSERERQRTLRGDVQAEGEAEALLIIRLFRDGRATEDGKGRKAFFLRNSNNTQLHGSNKSISNR